jgi:hypothetical protein
VEVDVRRDRELGPPKIEKKSKSAICELGAGKVRPGCGTADAKLWGHKSKGKGSNIDVDEDGGPIRDSVREQPRKPPSHVVTTAAAEDLAMVTNAPYAVHRNWGHTPKPEAAE